MLRRIKVILALAAAMTMLLAVGAAPAMADDIDRQCFPFCDGHNHNDNFDHNDFDNFDEFDIDDCELAFIDGELVWVCEVDFD